MILLDACVARPASAASDRVSCWRRFCPPWVLCLQDNNNTLRQLSLLTSRRRNRRHTKASRYTLAIAITCALDLSDICDKHRCGDQNTVNFSAAGNTIKMGMYYVCEMNDRMSG